MRTHTVLALIAAAATGAGVSALIAWNPYGSTPAAKQTGSSHEASAKPEAQEIYTCGMHPDVIRIEPGPCPICGMKLVPKKSGAEDHADDGGVRVAPSFLQNFGVRTTLVKRGTLPISIRTVGVLAHDEEKLVSVNTKFEGWIEKAYVNNVGESVEKGDVLFEIYSPQLVTTQREYLAAMDYVDRLVGNGAYPDAVARAESLLDAARERLQYWDVTDAQIEALEAAKEPSRTVRFFSPAAGFIVDKMGDSLPGMRLVPGMTVLKIADHSTLWAKAEFFEEDLRHVDEGSHASIDTDAFPGRHWNGRILFFRSAVNPETRALTAFVKVDNADLALRPMMYVNVSIRAQGIPDAVIVPAEAVLHSGERAVVVVAKGGGVFVPREVTLGVVAQGEQEIASGLDPGEQVVVSSQFLIDSESNLKARIAQMLKGNETDEPADGAMGLRHDH